MPRPTNKSALLNLGKVNYDQLMKFVEALSQDKQEGDFPEGTLNRNIRDVLMHLHHDQYKTVTLSQAKEQFTKSFNEVRDTIKGHTDDELFEKKRYKWTGTTSMGAYFISATSSHYDWALKLIKKAMK